MWQTEKHLLDDDTANQNIDVGANTLNIKGTGTVAVSADVRINNASSIIQMDGDETFLNCEVTTSADVTSSGAGRVGTANVFGLLLTNNVRIATLTVTKSLAIDITSGKTARIDAIVIGDGSAANTASVLKFVSGGNGGRLNNKTTNRGTLNLKKGSLDVDVDTSIGAVVSHTGDSIIDVASGKTLTLDDDTANQTIDIGGNTLVLNNSGTVTNSASFRLDNASSLLNMKTTAGGTLNKVSTGANITGASKGVDIDVNSTINTLTISHDCPVRIAATKELAGSVSIKAGELNLTETGKLTANVEYTGDTTAKTCGIDVDASCTISGNLSVTGTSTLCVLEVADGKTLTYEGNDFAVGTYTLQVKGGTGSNPGIFNNSGNGDLTFSTGTLDVDENFEIDGNITISDDAIIDVLTAKTLNYDGASIAVGTNKLTIYGAGTVDNANVFTLTGGDATAATPTGGLIDMKTNAAAATGTGTATIGGITITGTATVVNQINQITTKTTNGTIGVITATATDTAANCDTIATDSNDVLTLIINDAASTSVAATVLSSISSKTSLTPTVTNAIVITGTQTEINAALLTAATKVTAATATLSDSTYGTTTITGLQLTTTTSRATAASNGGTLSLTGLGITSEKTRHQILDRIFSEKSSINNFRDTVSNLSVSSASYNSITNTDVNVYQGTSTGQTINLVTAATNVAIYGALLANGDKIKFKASIGDSIVTYTVTRTSARGAAGAYTLTGNNSTETGIASGAVRTIGNNPGYKLVFGGVMVNGGSGSNVTTISGGDPYIAPIYGPTYKLPDECAFYRLYEKDDIIINGEVSEISNTKKQKLVKYYKKKGITNLKNVITDIFVFRAIYLSINGHKLAFNLNNVNWVTTKHSKDFFKVHLPNGENLKSKWFVGNEDGGACIKIRWDDMHEEKCGINLYFFSDPQKENGISLYNITGLDSLGLLVKNYKPELMKIENLTEMKSIKSNVKNVKDKFTTKPIKDKNEVWIKF